jgi:hypothetical protein
MFSLFTYIVSNFEKVHFSLLFLGSHYGTCHTSPYAVPIHTTHSNNPEHHPLQQTKSPSHPPPPSSLTSPITFLPQSHCPLPCHHRERCLIIPPHQVSPLFFHHCYDDTDDFGGDNDDNELGGGNDDDGGNDTPPSHPPRLSCPLCHLMNFYNLFDGNYRSQRQQ